MQTDMLEPPGGEEQSPTWQGVLPPGKWDPAWAGEARLPEGGAAGAPTCRLGRCRGKIRTLLTGRL